ncbi:MAG: sulfatase [Thermoanaerobaculia bacterium]
MSGSKPSLWICALALLLPAQLSAAPPRPSVLLLTVDTLRADRVSGYGYGRPTTPHLDRLMERGVRFTQARTEEPLTGPALVTMLTSLAPHQHGASRNGLRMRERLPSLPKALGRRGYRTVAAVANWTLRDELTGLAEHFDIYSEVLTRNRWFGLFREEAMADAVTDSALDLLEEQIDDEPQRPVLLWAHYVDPHAPYERHEEVLEQLGLERWRDLGKEDRYDTEIAFTDREIGRLLDALRHLDADREWLIVFAADHGESLGEHGYWGHGRHAYEGTLRIPLAVVWPGVVAPGTSAAPAVLADVAPTVLSLAGEDGAEHLPGRNWAALLRGGGESPEARVTLHQAHKGAVQGYQDADHARSRGLLEVARIEGQIKEILRVKSGRCLRFDLRADPAETKDLAAEDGACSDAIHRLAEEVRQGLHASDELPPPSLSAEDVEQLRSLGYLD